MKRAMRWSDEEDDSSSDKSSSSDSDSEANDECGKKKEKDIALAGQPSEDNPSEVRDKFLKGKLAMKLSPLPKRNDDCSGPSHVEINLTDLPTDPGLRSQISDYNLDDRDQIRRAYLQKGPTQPCYHTFPRKRFGQVFRRFDPTWFNECANWLEYSIEKDAAFCLCCYLFRPDIEEQAGGDSFVGEGFSNWKKKEAFSIHVGGPNSAHNQAWDKCQDVKKQMKQSEYQTYLNASIACFRFLLRQGLVFDGPNEFEGCSQGDFLALLLLLTNRNENIKSVLLENTPEDLKLTSLDMQKNIASIAVDATINTIVRDIGNGFFSVLIDESFDVARDVHIAIALRYVDKKGHVIERFLGIGLLTDTTALSLKAAIEELFSRHGLSMSRLRGQGYNGASNMQRKFNDLKMLIMEQNEYAFHVHSFVHELQSTLVFAALNHMQISMFFHWVDKVLNFVGATCKHCDSPWKKQATMVIEALEIVELPSRQGLSQETVIRSFFDADWRSHYDTLVNLIDTFSSVIDLLVMIGEDDLKSVQSDEADRLLDSMESFGFVFSLHLLITILRITNELSQVLQSKDQNIVIAMTLVEVSKRQLQIMRESGWDSLFDQVSSFCGKHNIDVPNMDDIFLDRGRSRRKTQEITNLQHYRVEFFYVVIDMLLEELTSRFTEANTELILCVACLSPNDSFSAFNKQKLIRLAQFYPKEFSALELMALDDQLESYIIDMRSSSEFSEVKGIEGLAKKMVETKRHMVYHLVYLLMTLALILPLMNATIERASSAMKIVKNKMRNRPADQWMSDNLVLYIEKEIFDGIDNEVIIQRLQNVKTSQGGQFCMCTVKPGKRRSGAIDFEALRRHGYKGGLSVLSVPPPKEDDKKQDWSWSTGREGGANKEIEESYEERQKTRAALADGELLENVQTRKEKNLSFSQKEKRKRELGQASRGKNYVEEEKRLLRDSGVYSGFDS